MVSRYRDWRKGRRPGPPVTTAPTAASSLPPTDTDQGRGAHGDTSWELSSPSASGSTAMTLCRQLWIMSDCTCSSSSGSRELRGKLRAGSVQPHTPTPVPFPQEPTPEERIHQVHAGDHGLLPNGRPQGVRGLCLDEVLRAAVTALSRSPGSPARPLPSGCAHPAHVSLPRPAPSSESEPSSRPSTPEPPPHHHLGHQLGLPGEVEGAGLRAAADGLAHHAHALDEAQLQAQVLRGEQAAGSRQHRSQPLPLGPQG